ncbi:MAG: penicillin-insensitive murein endopeptidase [Nitratireductor sp.]|nr:penicillin-insensitive murein endopeptidase [Nitratireductor sp.]
MRHDTYWGSRLARSLMALSVLAMSGQTMPAHAEPPAKQLFGAKALPANLPVQSVGFYSKGCIAGAQAIPVDGPDWQVMRLSRNRRWGHPELLKTIEALSVKARQDGWNGLLVGDISQPRGGPMLTGHASHQIGLDADIWFTPMPDHRLSYKEREETSAISVLKPNSFYVDDARWKPQFTRLLYNAASFPQVERILVHPGIKKKLCDSVKGDRSWLAKIRPYYGHHYHFHLRIKCPAGSGNCKPQAPVAKGDGCDKSLDWWFTEGLVPKKPAKPPKKPSKPKPPRYLTLSGMPAQCATILNADDVPATKAEFRTRETAFNAPEIEIPKVDPMAILASKPIEASKNTVAAGVGAIPANVPVPTPRPVR